MAFQQDFGASHKHKLSIPENSSGCFDCNICLDSCHEPVVTLCGHLYCWPCIYKWLNVQSSSFESDEPPKCPVCKALISPSSLVPLYGRGRSSSDSESKKPQSDLNIPHRPPAIGMNSPNQQNSPSPFQPENGPFHQQQFISNYTSITPPTFGGVPTTNSFYSPTINMVGEMVFAGIFGSSDTNLFPYPYSNSYPFRRNRSPRLRRQEMQLDKSLNRVSIFLFFCVALCLLLF